MVRILFDTWQARQNHDEGSPDLAQSNMPTGHARLCFPGEEAVQSRIGIFCDAKNRPVDVAAATGWY